MISCSLKGDKKEYMLTKGQKNALKTLKEGNNVFLTGNAGTGKSYVLNKFIEYCKKEKLNTIITAPTGIAAINVGGATLHRTFKAPLHPINEMTAVNAVSEAVTKADVIIIDEISMCRSDLFTYVARCINVAEAKENIHKQIVVCGDFFQLPPVCNPKDIEILPELKDKPFAFQTSAWADFNFTNIVLTEIVRQNDTNFTVSLNAIRRGNSAGLDWINKNASSTIIEGGIALAPTNRQVAEINQRESDKLDEIPFEFVATVKGEVNASDKFTDDYLTIKRNMRVMSVVNEQGGKYQNGSLGTVVDCNYECVTVKFDNGNEVTLYPYSATVNDYALVGGEVVANEIGSFKQIPLKIAYATTIHKSQGKTFDSVNLYPNCFAEGQLYVALSRVRDISGLHLMRTAYKTNLKTSAAVQEFYATFSPQEDDVVCVAEKPETAESAKAETKPKTTKKASAKKKAVKTTPPMHCVVGTDAGEKEEYVTIKVPKHLKEEVELYALYLASLS